MGLAVTAAPGPCAALAALCVAGLPTDRFFFEGFLRPSATRGGNKSTCSPQRPARSSSTKPRAGWPRRSPTSPSELGARPSAVARELTKLHEEIRRGALDALAAQYAAEGAPKGRDRHCRRPGRGAAGDFTGCSRSGHCRGAEQSLGQGCFRGGRGQARPAAQACLRQGARIGWRPAVRTKSPLSRTNRRRGGASFRSPSRNDCGASAAPEGLFDSRATVRGIRRRNRSYRAKGRVDRLRRGQGARRSRCRRRGDQRDEATAHRPGRARLARA